MEKQRYADRIFGVQDHPDERVKKAIRNTQGIQHRGQFSLETTTSGVQLRLEITTNLPFDVSEVCAWISVDGTEVRVDARRNGVSWSELDWAYLQHWVVSLELTGQPHTIKYWVAAFDPAQKHWIYADNQADARDAAACFALVIPLPVMPDWAKQAVIYQVFVDRFSPGVGRDWLQTEDVFGVCGGNLQGVMDHLDHIQSLGCNTIWLSPIFASDSHHGYNAKDLFTIEPRLGTLADFQRLLEAVHQRGMFLILDFVANHWSEEHPSFKEACLDQNSPYYDWYRWQKWPEEYDCYFGVKDLPEINLNHPAARQHVLDAAVYWLKQGVDGYRLDHAAGPPPDFWADFYTVCRSVNPACWLFGEIPADAPAQQNMARVNHVPLDFLLNRAFRETFAIQRWNLGQFVSFLHGQLLCFSGQSGPVFLDNHDMNRFLFACGDEIERLKQAAFLLFTLPNPPILYYGTEFGMTQDNPVHARPSDFGTFEMARFPIDWQQPRHELFSFFRQLFQLRKDWFGFWTGERRFEILGADGTCLVENVILGSQSVQLAVNLGVDSQTVPVDSTLQQEYWGMASCNKEGWQLPPGGIAFWY